MQIGISNILLERNNVKNYVITGKKLPRCRLENKCFSQRQVSSTARCDSRHHMLGLSTRDDIILNFFPVAVISWIEREI